MKDEKLKVAIIDSGVENIEKYNGVGIIDDDETGYSYCDDYSDKIGHGTMVTNIIASNASDCEIFVVKIFDTEEEISEQKLIYALEYVFEKVKPRIIHLSLGVSFCENIDELKNICDKIVQSGTIIVSAFDNNGAVSYPAAFDNVIGVGSNKKCIKTSDYIFNENSFVNIEAIGVAQRLRSIGGRYLDVIGSSFSAPYITSIIIGFLRKTNFELLDNKNILNLLKNGAMEVRSLPSCTDIDKPFNIESAILFPYNKEINTLILNNNNTVFRIKGVYDIKYLRNIGKKVLDDSIRIEAYENIDWASDFDTVILGHTEEISRILKKDIQKYFLEKCIQFNKKLYSFENITTSTEEKQFKRVYTPTINRDNIPYCNLGKLYQIGKPVVCFAGTSPKQGKFSAQLQVIEKLKNLGIKTAHLSTEPSGYLVGADSVFPMGYNSTVDLNLGEEFILSVNKELSQIEKNNPDIIVTGLQSQTIPMQVCSIYDMVLYNHYFLLGVNPDIVILVVNTYDDISYIKRTISYLESIILCEVLAIVIFPIERTFKWNTLGSLSIHTELSILEDLKNTLQYETNKQIYVLDRDQDMDMLCDSIIDYFKA